MGILLRYVLPSILAGAFGFVMGLLVAGSQEPIITHQTTTESGLSGIRSPAKHTRDNAVSIAGLFTSDQKQLSMLEEFAQIRHQENIFEQLHFAYSIASRSNFEQLETYMTSIIFDDDPLFNHNIASILLEKMVVLDPIRALDYIDNHRSNNQNNFISSILTSWIRHDPEAAIDYYKTIKNSQLKYMIGARLLEDPTLLQSGMLEEVEIALGSYSKQISEHVRFNRMAPANAFEEALLRTDVRRREFLTRAMSRWYQQDPEAAIQRVAVLTNQNEKRQLLQVIINMQSQQDPETALVMLEQYAPNDRDLKRQALNNFAYQNPVAALSRVESWIAETGNYDIMSTLVSSWIASDEVAALSYLDSIPAINRPEVLRALSSAYIRQSPEKGMEWVVGLDSELSSNLKRTAVNALMQYPDIAESWLSRLDTDPEMQANLMLQLSSAKARNDPAAAYQWLDSQKDSPNYESARAHVFQQWAQSDPENVASIIESEPDNRSIRTAFSQTAGHWATRDAEAAVSWVRSLPDSDNKKAAIEGIVSYGAGSRDPALTLSLIDSLPDNQAKNLRFQLANNLLYSRPGDIETILEDLQLDPQQLAQFRSLQKQREDQVTGPGY